MPRFPSFLLFLLVACGGRVDPTSTDLAGNEGAAASGTDASGSPAHPDASTSATAPDASPSTTGSGSDLGDTCTVVATSFDQSCTTDSDCVLVPPGGNICDPCDTPSSWPGAVNFYCQLATVNASVSAAYLNDIAPGQLKSGEGCSGDCPVPTEPKCQQGTCVIPTP